MDNSSFSNELKKYYTKQGNKLLFLNQFSLNTLAFRMWEELGCQGIDASILSKVINGKRLFSTKQLEAFCKILELPIHEVEILKTKLVIDDARKKEIPIHEHFVSKYDLIDSTIQLSDEVFRMFVEGKSKDLKNLTTLVNNNINNIQVKTTNVKLLKEMYNLYAKNIYIKCKTENLDKNPVVLFFKAYKTYLELERLGKLTQDHEIIGLSYLLLGSAYSEYAEIGKEEVKKSRYLKAIKYCNSALAILPPNNIFSIYAMRSLTAALCYVKDEAGILSIWGKIENSITQQPLEYRVPVLYMSGTTTIGGSLIKHKDPFRIRDKAISHFKESIYGKGVFELFDIKSELIALENLGIANENYAKKLISRAKYIAEQENCDRHFDFLDEYYSKHFKAH